MNTIAKKLIDAFLVITQTIFKNDFSDVQQVKLCWHHLNYISISIINHSRIFYTTPYKPNNFDIILSDMNKLGLFPENSLLFFKENIEVIESIFFDIIIKEAHTISHLDLSLFHERLLAFELKISRYEINVNIGKYGKDITGSYYTPTSLAQSVVNEAFEKYELTCAENQSVHAETNKMELLGFHNCSLYQGISIADLSCGGGEFIRAAQQYLFEKHGIPQNESCTYFWGIDVDPIALQITICNLLALANRNDWQTIISHFILGNPLVNTCEEDSFSGKSTLFANRRVYANGMGLDFTSELANKRFDIVIGNPPWEKIRFEERKYFANLCPHISAISQKDKRRLAISNLQKEWPEVYHVAMQACYDYSSINSGTFKHPKIKMSAVGELNTYALFTELAFELTKPSGVCSLIVKSALVTSPVNKGFWRKLTVGGFVHSVYLFENKQKIFNIDSREKFCVVTLSHRPTNIFRFVAGLLTAEEMRGNARSSLSHKDLAMVNPFTGMLPNVAHTEDMQVLIDVHNKLPLFESVYSGCHFGRLIHITAHADYIDTEANDNNIPIYEGKFIEQYDARFSTFASLDDKRKYAAKASAKRNIDDGNGKHLPTSRYFIQKSLWGKYKKKYPEHFSLCWRSLTSSTNARTTIAMILPTCPTCQSIQMLQVKDERELLLLLGLFNSIPFDYFVRLKMPGIDLTQSVIRQIPVPPENAYFRTIIYKGIRATIEKHIFSRLYCMLIEEPMVKNLLSSVNYPVYRIESESNEKSGFKKELDYLFAQAYEISDDVFKEILSTFPKY